MNESVIHLGIHFRSVSHYHWFVGSMILLGLSLLCSVLEMDKRPVDLMQSWWHWPVFCHAGTSVTAIFVTHFGQVNGPIYSVDCIWFNALMSLMNYFVFLFAMRLRLR
jgi:hypothetical protein